MLSLLRKSKTPRKSQEKWTFLSLAFYLRCLESRFAVRSGSNRHRFAAISNRAIPMAMPKAVWIAVKALLFDTFKKGFKPRTIRFASALEPPRSVIRIARFETSECGHCRGYRSYTVANRGLNETKDVLTSALCTYSWDWPALCSSNSERASFSSVSSLSMCSSSQSWLSELQVYPKVKDRVLQRCTDEHASWHGLGC